MRPADLDGVAEIERDNYDFPWSRIIFSDCLLAGYMSVVLEGDEGVIGYAIVSTAASEGHILNLCVAAQLQGRRHGQELLDYILEYVMDKRIRRLFLEVRPTNKPALNLYEKAGFTHLGVRKNYYKTFDGREDALVLVRELEPDLDV
jgi:ribosomal-protein-alanine N-acetyltransferase